MSLLMVLGVLPVTNATAQDVGPPPMERDSLESRVRQRMGQIVRTQLGLDNEQFRRLTVANRRFDGQRQTLFAQEREVRNGLRDEIESRDTTRNAQVATLLERMLALQRQQLDLAEVEQQELATFLTPLQRARYFGMQEQLRRRVMEMREQGMRRPPPGRRPPGAGGRRPPR